MYRLLTIFLFGFFGSVYSQEIQRENELLWEISGNGLKHKSYLFGSLHSNDKRLFRLPDSVYVALDRSQAIVLETDIFSLFDEWDTRKEEVKVLFDNKGNPYTGSSKATETVYGSEDGMPQFLDAYFLEYCYNSSKKFFALETVEEQLSIMAELGLPELDGFGLGTMEYLQEKMIEYYLRGDIDALDRMMQVNLSVSPGLYEDLIISRNVVMAKGIDSLVRQMPLFCAVGAGHLSGESGIITLLRKKGYRVRKVTAIYSEDPIAEKTKVRSFRNYTYVNETVGMVAVFPGKPKELKIWDDHPYLVYRELGQGNTYSIEIVPVDGSMSLEEQAAVYIATPDAAVYKHKVLDDGSEVFEGIADTYPEGLNWVRVMQNDQYLLIIKAYGGNKFMNSNRPSLFFSRVWFE